MMKIVYRVTKGFALILFCRISYSPSIVNANSLSSLRKDILPMNLDRYKYCVFFIVSVSTIIKKLGSSLCNAIQLPKKGYIIEC